MSTLLSDFTQEIQHLLGYSKTTADAYAGDIRRFLQYLRQAKGAEASLDAAQSDDVLAFLRSEIASGRRKATVHRRVAALRVLERYLRLSGRREAPFMPDEAQIAGVLSDSAPSRVTGCLTTEDLLRLWQTLLASPKRQARRDLALMALMVEWGFPVGVLLNAQVSEADLKGRALWVPQMTGTLKRWPLEHAYEPLAHYLTRGRPDLSPKENVHYLFISQQGRPLSRQSTWHSLRVWGQEAGLETPLTPRVLRATAALRMMLLETPPWVIGEAMGHTNPLSTTVLLARLKQQCGHITSLTLPRVTPEGDTLTVH